MRTWTGRLMAWWLLALLVLSVAPREVLHHCDGHHADVTGPQLHAACAVSDHALPVAEPCAAPALADVHRVFLEVSMAVPALVPQRAATTVLDRGPPTIG